MDYNNIHTLSAWEIKCTDLKSRNSMTALQLVESMLHFCGLCFGYYH